MNWKDIISIPPEQLDLIKRLPKNTGYNACVSINEDGSQCGLICHNEHEHQKLTSSNVDLFANNSCAIHLEGDNDKKKCANSADIYTNVMRIMSDSLDIYTNNNSFRWMNSYLNPDLNVAFKYNKYMNPANIDGDITSGNYEDTAATAITSLTGGVGAELVYRKVLLENNLHLPTMNPAAIGILQALITALPKYLEEELLRPNGPFTSPDHIHIDFLSILKTYAGYSVAGIVKDKEIPNQTDDTIGVEVGKELKISPSVDGKLLFKKSEQMYNGSLAPAISNNVNNLMAG